MIARQSQSALRLSADLGSNPARGGKQPSAICRAGTAGQTEGTRTTDLRFSSSKEENSMEKCTDMPPLTQGTCSSTAKLLSVGLEKQG